MQRASEHEYAMRGVTSKYRGVCSVCWDESCHKWRAAIRGVTARDGQQRHLGAFSDEEGAARTRPFNGGYCVMSCQV